MKRVAALSLILFLSQQIYADTIILDDVMDRDMQRKTGINKLSYQQKVQLEIWINDNFVLKSEMQPPAASTAPMAPPSPEMSTAETPAPEQELFLSINIDNGQKLQLSDGSIWEIAPADVPKTAVWITPFPIEISPSGDPKYPSYIINKDSGDKVKARQAAESP